MYKFIKLNLVLIFNEKCACTTIKNFINDIDKLYKIKHYQDVHNYNFNNIKIKDLLKNNYTIIFIIRNPYDRFISGYTKITNRSRLKLHFDSSKSLKECNNIIMKTRREVVDINEWCKIITDISKNNLESHFTPQTLGLPDILIDKCILYDINKLDNINNYINNLLNINIKFKVHSKGRDYKDSRFILSDKSRKLIYKYYKDDFVKLNYLSLL
tara:strand:+ start:968 stop:1606 length:639 start_codon:yes stop_codon:yes gene_type:complete